VGRKFRVTDSVLFVCAMQHIMVSGDWWCVFRHIQTSWLGAAAVDGVGCNGLVVSVCGFPLTAAETVRILQNMTCHLDTYAEKLYTVYCSMLPRCSLILSHCTRYSHELIAILQNVTELHVTWAF